MAEPKWIEIGGPEDRGYAYYRTTYIQNTGVVPGIRTGATEEIGEIPRSAARP